jgi:hypothetical protein
MITESSVVQIGRLLFLRMVFAADFVPIIGPISHRMIDDVAVVWNLGNCRSLFDLFPRCFNLDD